ncbi:hypothetical protein ABIE49_001129 [Bradyrhizobium sp. OAE829]
MIMNSGVLEKESAFVIWRPVIGTLESLRLGFYAMVSPSPSGVGRFNEKNLNVSALTSYFSS